MTMIRSREACHSDHLYGLICAALAAAGLVACGSGGGSNGANGAGGATSATAGGMSSAAGTGGVAANGGNQSAAGASSGGGSGASVGGTTQSGGATGSAGTTPASGGTPSTGGSTAAGGMDPGSTPDAGAVVSLSELPLMLADASCGALEQCLGTASARFFDGGSCKASLEPATVEGSASVFAALVAKSTLAYDPTKVPACLSNIRSSGCDYPERRLDALCPGVVVGKVAAGSACSVNAECGAAGYCKTTTCPGTCAPLVAKGGACSGDDDCADGLVCDATSKKCFVPGKKGDACSTAAPCGTTFVCDASAHCVDFGSIFAATAGQPCDPEGQVLCQPTLTCALVGIDAQQKGMWSCEKPPTAAACHVSLPEQCASGNFCELAGGLTGTCKAAPKESAPCVSRLPSDTTVAKDICGPNLTCWSDGVCHARAHLTEACTTNDDCFSGTCKGKVCVATSCAP